MSADPQLSAECAVAQRTEYADLHTWCRRTADVSLAHRGGVVLVPRCSCACHVPVGEGAR
ncbi:hypothetical protein ACFRI7_15360 [Streptomyces sp. NPDC056716]|uniref:hypothetical protein n=1 Tax=unclassified Streptomyces TaxID=2593676 RepID=UPI00368F9C44